MLLKRASEEYHLREDFSYTDSISDLSLSDEDRDEDGIILSNMILENCTSKNLVCTINFDTMKSNDINKRIHDQASDRKEKKVVTALNTLLECDNRGLNPG